MEDGYDCPPEGPGLCMKQLRDICCHPDTITRAVAEKDIQPWFPGMKNGYDAYLKIARIDTLLTVTTQYV
jgi:hypothetical protein